MGQKRSNDAIVKGEDEKCPKKQLTMDFCLRQRLGGHTENAGDDTGGNNVEIAGVSDDTDCEGTPQKKKRTAAKSATKRSGGCWLVREKEMYNPFNYRCSEADGLREHWQEFKQYASEEDQRRFVLDVINAKPGIIPPAALERKERLIRNRTSGSTSSWISFKAAADVDGEDIVKEWIANGTVRTRFNPKLTKDTQIKWPFFLEIAKETEVWSDLDKLKTEQVKTETMEDTEGFKSDFDGRWGCGQVKQRERRRRGTCRSIATVARRPRHGRDEAPSKGAQPLGQNKEVLGRNAGAVGNEFQHQRLPLRGALKGGDRVPRRGGLEEHGPGAEALEWLQAVRRRVRTAKRRRRSSTVGCGSLELLVERGQRGATSSRNGACHEITIALVYTKKARGERRGEGGESAGAREPNKNIKLKH